MGICAYIYIYTLDDMVSLIYKLNLGSLTATQQEEGGVGIHSKFCFGKKTFTDPTEIRGL